MKLNSALVASALCLPVLVLAAPTPDAQIDMSSGAVEARQVGECAAAAAKIICQDCLNYCAFLGHLEAFCKFSFCFAVCQNV